MENQPTNNNKGMSITKKIKQLLLGYLDFIEFCFCDNDTIDKTIGGGVLFLIAHIISAFAIWLIYHMWAVFLQSHTTEIILLGLGVWCLYDHRNALKGHYKAFREYLEKD